MPAPRAGERTLSAFFHWLHPLRPAPGTVRSRLARGRFSELPLYTPARHSCGNYRSPTRASRRQTIPAKLHTRSRHKRQSLSASQTSRFNFPISAFIGVSAKLHYSGREPFSPAPTFPPVGAGRGSIPVEGDCKFAPANLASSMRGLVPLSGRTFPSFSLAKTVSTSLGKVTPARGAQKKILLLINRRTQSVQLKGSPAEQNK